MIILLDLDGTLIDTAKAEFKPMKDGEIETDLAKIPVFPGAKEFITFLLDHRHTPIIISDSHPKYVTPIVQNIFNVPFLFLADKPNTTKTSEFLKQLNVNLEIKDNIILIGDTWLDIELGRGLRINTILTRFYIAEQIEERDGIGKTWHQLKSGPTFYARSYQDLEKIISDSSNEHWVAEAFFCNMQSVKAIRLSAIKHNDQWTIFRSLGRQEVGECDKYALAAQYKEFQKAGRSKDMLNILAKSLESYLQHVLTSAPQFNWDYISYVSDKATTNPPNKMKEFFELINCNIAKVDLLKWSDNVDGSIRNRENYRKRRDFIAENLFVIDGIDLSGKNVIVIDDQFTTGGTAYETVNMLRNKGANNVLFVTMFFMNSLVESSKKCPRCSNNMQIKIRNKDGVKFFSCTPPQYKGTGCGYAENII